MKQMKQMKQSYLSFSFPINILDKLVIKAVIVDLGLIASYVAEAIASRHGIDKQEVLESIQAQLQNGTFVNRNGRLHPAEGLILKNRVACIGGDA